MGYSTESLAYVAGIIDGEGSISISGQQRRSKTGTLYWMFDVEVGAYNTSTTLMYWLINNFGGEFSKRTKQPRQSKPCYRWRLPDNSTRVNFLSSILPFLVVKSDQAKYVLEYLHLPRISPTRRLELCQLVQKLNARAPRKRNT